MPEQRYDLPILQARAFSFLQQVLREHTERRGWVDARTLVVQRNDSALLHLIVNTNGYLYRQAAIIVYEQGKQPRSMVSFDNKEPTTPWLPVQVLLSNLSVGPNPTFHYHMAL